MANGRRKRKPEVADSGNLAEARQVLHVKEVALDVATSRHVVVALQQDVHARVPPTGKVELLPSLKYPVPVAVVREGRIRNKYELELT